jgi:hypothetical protein
MNFEMYPAAANSKHCRIRVGKIATHYFREPNPFFKREEQAVSIQASSVAKRRRVAMETVFV